MKLLLDTQCWLWIFSSPERLNAAALKAISHESNEMLLSVASIWELGIKVAIGKLSLPEPIDAYLAKRLTSLRAKPLNITHCNARPARRLSSTPSQRPV